MTGDELFFFFFFCCFVSTTFLLERTRRSRSLASRCWAPSRRCPPGDFVDSGFGFWGPCGVLLPLGGWVPLLCFPGVFPKVLGWEGGAFFSLLPLASCVFLS